MGPEISSSTQTLPPRLPSTNYSKPKNTDNQGATQKVRQAQAEQQRAAQNLSAAQAAAQESQNNLRTAQSEERQATDKVSLAQAEQRKNNQPQQTQTTGKNINVMA